MAQYACRHVRAGGPAAQRRHGDQPGPADAVSGCGVAHRPLPAPQVCSQRRLNLGSLQGLRGSICCCPAALCLPVALHAMPVLCLVMQTANAGAMCRHRSYLQVARLVLSFICVPLVQPGQPPAGAAADSQAADRASSGGTGQLHLPASFWPWLKESGCADKVVLPASLQQGCLPCCWSGQHHILPGLCADSTHMQELWRPRRWPACC